MSKSKRLTPIHYIVINVNNSQIISGNKITGKNEIIFKQGNDSEELINILQEENLRLKLQIKQLKETIVVGI
jgi:hypothetical protein